MIPTVGRLESSGYPVRKINITWDRAAAQYYRVSRVPTFVMLVDGREVDRVVGAADFGRLERLCRMGRGPNSIQQPNQGWLASVGRSPGSVAIPPSPGSSLPESLTTGSVEAAKASPMARPAPSADGATQAWPDHSAASGRLDAELLAATVRLRIEDDNGRSCGTGTIIDARNGKALILTCGHVFRDSKGNGRIEVDLFGPAGIERTAGSLLSYDEDRDLGLLLIETRLPLTVVRVAPPEYRVSPGDSVINVGCNNGEEPTVRHNRVTSLDRFLGPPNVQVGGLPVLGRSGGGLFSEEGLLVGVCNFADPQENEGTYAALESIHAELDRAELSFVYRPLREVPRERAPLVAVQPPPMPKRMPAPSRLVQLTESPMVSGGPPLARSPNDSFQPLDGKDRATLEEIRRRKAEGAEVIFIVRPRSDPRAQSEIFVLDHVSAEFLHRLSLEEPLAQ
jgi:S1-C subfamily serine protease